MKDDPTRHQIRNRAHWPLVAIFTIHVAFSLIYNRVIPLNRGPDEESHYRYIQHLVKFQSLPRITRPGDPDGTRDERTGAIAIHPPLYYVCAVPVYIATSSLNNEWRQRALRLLATVFAIGTLLLVLRIARALFPEQNIEGTVSVEALTDTEFRNVPGADVILANRKALCMASHVGTVAFVAMLPHFLMISSVINNDGLFILFNTLLVWLIVRSVCAETVVPGQMVAIGAVFGLCLLTKGSAVAMIPLMLLVALMHSKEEREYSVRKLFIYSATIFVPAFIIAGWWYVWYAQVHGRMYLIPKAGDPPMRYDSVMELLQSGNAGYLIWRYLVGIAKSIWSQVDWILPNDPAHPEQATSAAYPVSRLIWIGMMLNMLSQTLLNIPFLLYGRVFLRQFRGILLTYCHFGCYFLALMYSTLFIHPGGFQGGRYLLPSVCALAIFFQLPWFVLGSYFPGERMRYAGHYMVFLILVSPFLLILWNVTCIKNLIGFLIPVYSG